MSRQDHRNFARIGWIGALAATLLASSAGGIGRTATPVPAPPGTIIVAKPGDLGPVLAPIQEKYKLPGMIAAILEGEHITAIGAVGVRKIGAPDPMTPHDVIHIGSCTKAMTATMIARLVEEKKLGWDTPLAQALPRLAPFMNADAAKITVAQLLNHTAGLSGNVAWADYDRTHKPLPEQRFNLAKDVLSKPPATPPGQTYLYSNAGYVVLGLIVEQIRAVPWETLIRDELFVPLGMRSAGLGAPGTPGMIDQPWGHTGSPPNLKPVHFDNPPCLGPAGCVHCTIEDWARFVSLHMQGLQGQAHLISAETFAALHTPAPGQGYAGGWFGSNPGWADGIAYNHAGSNTSWYCTVWMAPKKNFAVLVVTNSGQGDAGKACDDANTALVDYHLKPKAAGK